MSAPSLQLAVALPAGFRVEDILQFHRRDREAVAEAVGTDRLRKGLLWRGLPACLEVVFAGTQAHVQLAIDGPVLASDLRELDACVSRMLGLTQAVEDFEARYGTHPELGPLIARQRGLRVPVAASPFEALVWAITGQQISVHAAISMRRKLILATGVPHSAGLYCHPDAPRLAGASEATLRGAGLTASKAATVLAVSAAAADGRLPLADWTRALPAAEAEHLLLAQRGIGPWTVNYTLLRGYGWLDGSLQGDVAVRRSLQQLLGEATRLEAARTAEWLAQFSPWRALVAAHLWAAGG